MLFGFYAFLLTRSPLKQILILLTLLPDDIKENKGDHSGLKDSTCIFPCTPVLSILLATFTVFPQMSYCGLLAPITPATTGPTLIPGHMDKTFIFNENTGLSLGLACFCFYVSCEPVFTESKSFSWLESDLSPKSQVVSALSQITINLSNFHLFLTIMNTILCYVLSLMFCSVHLQSLIWGV